MTHDTSAGRPAGLTEALVDESIEESFLASDPPSSAQPGSAAELRYADRRSRRDRSRLAMALGVIAVAALAWWLRRARRTF